MFSIIVHILSLIILLLFIPEKKEFFSESLNLIFSVIAVINVISFWWSLRNVFKSWLRFDVLFIIGFVIVHFQIPFLASLGIEPDDPAFIWVNKDVVNFASWVSAVVLILWMLGFSLYISKNKENKKLIRQSSYILDTNKFDTVLGLLFILFLATVGTTFIKGAYDMGAWGAGANYYFLLLRVTLQLRILYFFVSYKRLVTYKNRWSLINRNKLFIIILCLYVFLFLVSGDRGPVLQIALLIGGAYSIYTSKISFSKLVSFIFVGAIVFTIIGLGRSREINDNSGNLFQRGYERLNENDEPLNPTGELATSVRIQYTAFDVVPDQHPYLYGVTIFSNAIGVIPFASSAFINLTELPLQYTSSSYFFTIWRQGLFLSSGDGSEIIADLYINFGMYGVLLVMFVFGYFSGFVSWKSQSQEFISTIIFLFLLMYAITINRAPFLAPLKDIVYALVINSIFLKFVLKKKI